MQYEDGRGVATDLQQALRLSTKRPATPGVADGCQKLGDDYWYGIGIKADKQKGAALLKEGCALGSKWACQEVNFLRQQRFGLAAGVRSIAPAGIRRPGLAQIRVAQQRNLSRRAAA